MWISAERIASAGRHGNFNGVLDEDSLGSDVCGDLAATSSGALTSAAAFTGTYRVDNDGFGRGVIAVSGDQKSYPFYLVGPGKGFIIDSSARAGMFEPQTGGPFINGVAFREPFSRGAAVAHELVGRPHLRHIDGGWERQLERNHGWRRFRPELHWKVLCRSEWQNHLDDYIECGLIELDFLSYLPVQSARYTSGPWRRERWDPDHREVDEISNKAASSSAVRVRHIPGVSSAIRKLSRNGVGGDEGASDFGRNLASSNGTASYLGQRAAHHTQGSGISVNARKKSMRDRLEVIRQTLFGLSQDFHDGLTVGEREFGILMGLFFA